MTDPKPIQLLAIAALCSALASGCGHKPASSSAALASPSAQMKRLISTQISAWLEASRALANAAPLAAGRGWDPELDMQALTEMRNAWHRARSAYERIEGAIAPLFPESDLATDARYDDYLADLGSSGDANAFDDQGVIGMHAIERILWANAVPRDVESFERGLPGYRKPAFPANEAEARAFKQQLCARMVRDIEKLAREFTPLELDTAFVFRGTIDLAAEQVEKVDRAATGQEESRYAQATLKDLRANREGCLDAYRVFRAALLERPKGPALDRTVMAAFDRLKRSYEASSGDAIPQPPENFSRLAPTAAQLATPFGVLWRSVRRESDDKVQGSLRASLTEVAEQLDLPALVTR